LAPPMLRLHERAGVVAPVVLVALATAVDVVRIHFAVEPVAYLNFLFVFLFCQQLGFFWLEGRLSRRRWWPATMLVGGVAALWLLTHVGPYPLSMVGVPGERIANNAPPTIAFVALGLAQIGLVMVLRRPMDRWLRRPRVWGSVIAVNAHAMTVHLWHLTALVIVAVVVLPLHVVPVLEDGTGGWWLSRVLALPVLSLPLLALVLTFGRYERRGAPAVDEPARPALATAATVLAVPCLSIALMLVTLNGLSIEGAPAGVPMVPIALLAVGSALLLVGRRGDDRSVGEGEGPVEQVGLLGGVHAGDTCGR
jgi:hypothetical protein